MRKAILAGLLAALGCAALPVPASASFDPHFSVLFKQVGVHQVGNRFTFKDELFDPHNPSDRVGRDHGLCRQKKNRRLQCKFVIALNGEIGGFGYIRVNGNLGPGDSRLNVVGGSDDFNGVAGKVLLHSLPGKDRLHFDLVH